MVNFDELIANGEHTKAARLFAKEYYDSGKMGHTRKLLIEMLADKCDKYDEAIARQSVKSEDVAEAIEELMYGTWQSYKDGYPITLGDKTIDLAITALQAYQPWISVKDRLPESEKSVLLLCEVRPMGMKYVCIGYYAAPKSVESNCDDIEMLEYDEDTDAYYLQEGYYEEIRNWDEYSSIAIGDFVIGWKPLPKPPKGD